MADDGVQLAPVPPGKPVKIGALVKSDQFSSKGSGDPEPKRMVQSAEYYIDIPPWVDTALAIPMASSDGFDSTEEEVSAIIDTTSLSSGRHQVYVRGQVAGGQWGVVSSIFFRVQ